MATVVELELIAKTAKAEKAVESLNNKVEDVADSSKKLQEQNKKTTKSFKYMRIGVKALGAALKAAGIGLVIAAFVKIGDIISKNQKVLDTLTTVWTSFEIVVRDLWNSLTNFDQTLISIGETIQNIIIERFSSALRAIGFFGSALLALTRGDLKEANELAIQGVANLVNVGPELEKTINKWKDYTLGVYETADAFTQLENEARLAEAQLRRVFEQSDRDAERQRRLRDNFNATAEERLAASEKLAEILNEQEETQLRLAGLEVQRARQNIKINGDNIDNQIALVNALAEQDAIEADIAGRRTEQEEQDRMLRKELLDLRQQEIGEVMNLEKLRVEDKKATLDEEVNAVFAAREKEKEINKQTAEANALIAKKEAEAKSAAFDATAQALTNLSVIAGNDTVAGKALAIAASLINTYQGITKSLAVGGFAGIAQSIAVGAAGFAAVKSIIDTPIPGAKGGGSGGQSPSNPTPQFNLIGQGGVNQLAQTLNQDQDPVQAFVVGSNVTSQQELDRNITETATIG